MIQHGTTSTFFFEHVFLNLYVIFPDVLLFTYYVIKKELILIIDIFWFYWNDTLFLLISSFNIFFWCKDLTQKKNNVIRLGLNQRLFQTMASAIQLNYGSSMWIILNLMTSRRLLNPVLIKDFPFVAHTHMVCFISAKIQAVKKWVLYRAWRVLMRTKTIPKRSTELSNSGLRHMIK